MCKKVGMILAVIALLAMVSISYAAAIGNPTAANGWNTTSAVSVRGSHPGYGSREWIYTIDGSGLDAATGTIHVTAGPYGGPFVVMGIAGGIVNPRGGTINDGTYGDRWVEYSFDKAYELDRMDIWAYNENGDYAWSSMTIKDTVIQISTTGGTDPAEWTTVTTTTLAHVAVPNQGTPVTDMIDFGGAQAKYVVITLKNGYDGTYTKGNVGVDNPDFGLSEVRFYEIPEPATITLLCLAGWLSLKRRA